jgi:hydrogenase expression/formation protein HypC
MCLAVPGKLVSVDDSPSLFRMGKVNFGGIFKEVNLAYVPEAKLGDYVLVHVGFALNIIDEAEANQVFEYLQQIDELTELGGRPDA